MPSTSPGDGPPKEFLTHEEVDLSRFREKSRMSYFSRKSMHDKPRGSQKSVALNAIPSFLRQSIRQSLPSMNLSWNRAMRDKSTESEDTSDVKSIEHLKSMERLKSSYTRVPKNNLRGMVNALLDSNLKSTLAPMTLRERVWQAFEDPSSSNIAQGLAIWIMILIILSCVSFIVETDVKYVNAKLPVFGHIEFFCIIQFTIEYILRLTVSPDKKQFMKSFLNGIDLIAIMPFYIEELLKFDSNTAFLRIIRLARVFRVFKISRYLSWITVFVNAVVNSAQPLFMLLYVMLIATVFFSSIMYFLERGTWNNELQQYQRINPRTLEIEFSPYQSIPGTFWWCVITMTTVGYGDAVPITWQGRILASVASLCGILVFAVPITVISKTFDSELNHMQQLQKLGIGKLRNLKQRFIQAARGEVTSEGQMSAFERQRTRYRRKQIMIDLINYLQSDEENFDWDDTKHLTASNLRAILSYFVTNQIAAVVAEADSQLLNSIKRSINEHRRDVQYEIKTLLNELPDKKSASRIQHFERHIEDLFLHKDSKVDDQVRPSHDEFL